MLLPLLQKEYFGNVGEEAYNYNKLKHKKDWDIIVAKSKLASGNQKEDNNIKYMQLEYDYYEKKEQKAIKKDNIYVWIYIISAKISILSIILIFTFMSLAIFKIDNANDILKQSFTKTEESDIVVVAYYEIKLVERVYRYNLIIEVNNNSQRKIKTLKIIDNVTETTKEISNIEKGDSTTIELIADVKEDSEYMIEIEEIEFEESPNIETTEDNLGEVEG